VIERAKGQVLMWAFLPDDQRAADDDLDVKGFLQLVPSDAERCEAASQGNYAQMGESGYRLVKTGRFFRCVQRRKRYGQGGGRFCHRHQAISERGAAAVR
jgi:hypothetical protein